MRKEMFAGMLGIFLVAGCAPQIVYVPIKEKLPLRKPEEVQIFSGEPKVPYKVLGVVEVRSGWLSKEVMIKELKKKAWLAGADAVINVEYRRGGEKVKKAKMGQYAQSKLLWSLPERKINNLFGEFVIRGEAVKFIKNQEGEK